MHTPPDSKLLRKHKLPNVPYRSPFKDEEVGRAFPCKVILLCRSSLPGDYVIYVFCFSVDSALSNRLNASETVSVDLGLFDCTA